MSKINNDLFIVIIFSIIWIIRPISYDEMRSRHPIYPQENIVVVNSSSISTKNDELEYLEGNTEIILAKSSSGNFFADGSKPPLTQRPGSRTTSGIGGSNPGSGSGGSSSSAPSSGNLDGSCPTPKSPHQLLPTNQKK
jgi:hypothetical protein